MHIHPAPGTARFPCLARRLSAEPPPEACHAPSPRGPDSRPTLGGQGPVRLSGAVAAVHAGRRIVRHHLPEALRLRGAGSGRYGVSSARADPEGRGGPSPRLGVPGPHSVLSPRGSHPALMSETPRTLPALMHATQVTRPFHTKGGSTRRRWTAGGCWRSRKLAACGSSAGTAGIIPSGFAR